MKMKNFKRVLAGLVTVVVASSMITGCGKKEEKVETTTLEDGTEVDVQKIIVGTGSAYNPVCYLDEDGNLVGYEIEVFKAIDELLPQYEIEFEIFDFKNIVLALDSDKIDIGAHQYEWNEEREANYLFGKVPYTSFKNYLWVIDGVTDVNSLADLAGKTLQVSAGSNVAYVLETYNADNPGKEIVLDYSTNATTEEWIANLTAGKYAATIGIERDMEYYNEAYADSAHFNKVGEPITNSDTYYLYKKGNTELQEVIDGALQQLKDSGKLAEISTEIWGADYTK